MQTFLPYPDLAKSATALDNKRLGKQRVEALQIINVLEGKTKAWRNHPAVKMWQGHVTALKAYYNACVIEWEERGFKNTMSVLPIGELTLPPWFGFEIHANHRARLLAKQPDFYAKYGWAEKPTEINFYPGTGYFCKGKKIQEDK